MCSNIARLERTLGAATRFVDEMRAEIGREAAEGVNLPPRLRCVHERPGHATPEYRTLAIPVPREMADSYPEILSAAIARFAVEKPPSVLLLALDLTLDTGSGPGPVLVAEARDASGTRLFWMQPYRSEGGVVAWEEPLGEGWRDPGEEEMILDAAFRVQPVKPAKRGAARGRRRAGSGSGDRGDARPEGLPPVALGMAADGRSRAPERMDAPGRAAGQE